MPDDARAHRVAEGFRRYGIVAWALIGMLILGAVTGWALMQVREVFPALVLALITIYLLNPAVSSLERAGVPRLAGSCLSYVLVLGLIAAALLLLIPLLTHQVQGFVRDFPRTLEHVGDIADDVSRDLQRRFPTFDAGSWLRDRANGLTGSLGAVGHFLVGAVRAVAIFLVGPVIAFYLLVDLPRLQRTAKRLIPPHRRDEISELAATVATTMGNFFRGQFIVAVIVGVMSSIAMLVIGLPYWAVVGMIAGLFNMIPLIGPFIGAIPGILIAAAFRSPLHMLWVSLAMLVVQQIDNHFISPNVMRFTVRLHPVSVMLSLLAGATLAGFWGMLLAVPFVASIKLVASHFWRTRVPWGHEVFEAAAPATSVPPGDTPPSLREGG